MNKSKNECYTPAYFVDPIREFAHGFDYDPFSCELANQTIKAKEFSSIESNQGWYYCDRFWSGINTIWCNPPYSTKLQQFAVDKICIWKDGKEIYLLLNTDNSTKAYRKALEHCQALMLVKDRIKFIRPYADKPNTGNNRSQTLFFFGSIDRAKEFKVSLSHLGHILINN